MQLSASRDSWWLKLNQCKKKVCQTSLWGKEDSVSKSELTGAGRKSCFSKFKQKIKFCSFGVSAWEKSYIKKPDSLGQTKSSFSLFIFHLLASCDGLVCYWHTGGVAKRESWWESSCKGWRPFVSWFIEKEKKIIFQLSPKAEVI